ncbi:HAMP domain-containing protein [bacterium]|nr:HAMP domain-containing protein [bacterium]
MNKNKVSLTTQNRLIIFGLLLSTFLIISIAIFAIYNIQNKLNEGYQSFGKVISKALAVECVELSEQMPLKEAFNAAKSHADTILKSHPDIVYIQFRDEQDNITYFEQNKQNDKRVKSNIIVTSQIAKQKGNINTYYGSVTVAFSGKIIEQISSTTRSSLLFVFLAAWVIFAFVVLINTYLITRELRILQEGVRRISTGEFGYTIEGKEVSQEVEELFNAFNEMSHKLHIYEEQNIEQLTLERNKLEAILMSIANGVVVCDNTDNVVLVNDHAQFLLEIEENQLLNTKIQNYLDSAGSHCFADKIEEFKDTPLSDIENKPISFNIVVDNRTIKSIISPMFTRNKDYVGYIIVLIDMTKEAEMDMMRSNFISNVSHELRTPVTVLRSYIDTLYTMGNEFDYETQKEFIGTINQEIIRLNNMVNDILDFSRLESGYKLHKDQNNIIQLVESCVNQLGVLIKEHNLTVSMHKEGDIPTLMFNYDSISRAFTNLMSNAIKYSPDNTKIEVSIKRADDLVEISVKDEGCGIPPECQKKVFDRFYRVENNTHTIKGTGLGLYLVKSTIEKHDGEVFLISEEGEGSTFGFRLPVNVESNV